MLLLLFTTFTDSKYDTITINNILEGDNKMDIEIKKIIDRYIEDDKLKKYSSHYYSDYVYTENAKSKEDMSRMTMGIDSTLNYYNEQASIADQDIEVMERRIAEYELAVFKIFEEILDSDLDYSANDLKIFLEHISAYYRKLENIKKIERTKDSKVGYTF